MESVVTLNSGQTLEFRTVKLMDQPRTAKPSALLAHVNTLRFPVPNGEPCENPGSGHGLNELGGAPYLGRILGVLVSDRVNLIVGSTGEKMCPHEGLDIRIIALETRIKTARPGIKSARGLT